MQVCQGAFCIGLGLADSSFPGTVVLIIIFSLFVQSCEGACFAIVPFVSKRALGAVNGIVGAGGDFGSVLTQVAFFRFGSNETNKGIVYMGILIICASVVVLPIYFPAWGGMIFPAKSGATEEDYYLVR
jgi:MFS transporter, NNP family, nitrate/nitrite transporter